MPRRVFLGALRFGKRPKNWDWSIWGSPVVEIAFHLKNHLHCFEYGRLGFSFNKVAAMMLLILCSVSHSNRLQTFRKSFENIARTRVLPGKRLKNLFSRSFLHLQPRKPSSLSMLVSNKSCRPASWYKIKISGLMFCFVSRTLANVLCFAYLV